MKSFLFILSTAMLFCITACNNEKDGDALAAPAMGFSLDSVKSQITASNSLYGDCFGKNDSATFVNCYTSDACINPPNMPKMCGRASIGAYFSEGVKMGIKQIKLTTTDVAGGRDGIIETGQYEVLGDKAVSFEKGKFIVWWKEEDGKWKMHNDIWNSDAAAPPPAK